MAAEAGAVTDRDGEVELFSHWLKRYRSSWPDWGVVKAMVHDDPGSQYKLSGALYVPAEQPVPEVVKVRPDGELVMVTSARFCVSKLAV